MAYTNKMIMTLKSNKIRSILVLMYFMLFVQNSDAKQEIICNDLLETTEYISHSQLFLTDTLTTIEKENFKRKEEKYQQNETKEADLITAKEMDIYVKEKKSFSDSHSYISQSDEKGSYSFSKKEKAVTFGIRAGANFASLELDPDINGKCSMITSYHAGINLDFRLAKVLHLNLSALFSEKGYKYENKNKRLLQETAKAQFISIPLQFALRFGVIQINAGGYFDYGIGGEIDYGDTIDTFEYFPAINYGVTTGLGFNIGKHVYLGANYEIGLSEYANRNIAVSFGVNF